MNYQIEIEHAIRVACNQAAVLIETLESQGLTILPIPKKQVHDVDRLILAEKIVASRRKIQKMRATEVFENHGALVKNLDKDVEEYFQTYAMLGEGLNDGQ